MRTFATMLAVTLLPLLSALAQEHASGPNSLQHVPVAAEPDSGAQYPKYTSPEDMNPQKSDLDIGPAQKNFVMASLPDTLADSDSPPTVNTLSADTIKLDPRIKIKTIHEVETDTNYPVGDNAALRFELDYLNYGAVTAEERDARKGHYFTITWCNKGPKDDYTARFQYREVITKDIVRTLLQPMPAAHDNTRAYFAVVGKAFHLYGPINAWRISILKGDTVVADEKSIAW